MASAQAYSDADLGGGRVWFSGYVLVCIWFLRQMHVLVCRVLGTTVLARMLEYS